MNTNAINSSPIRILRRPDVLLLLGVTSPTLWRWVRDGHFPKPIQMGPKIVGWRERDVTAWIDAKAAAANQ